MNREKLFIDFDGTLFDTFLFKASFFRILEKAGFSQEDIVSTYQAEGLDYKYSPKGQFERLKKVKKFNEGLALARLEDLYKKSQSFLFEDSVNFLKEIDREKNELILLTLGDIEFQRRKVSESKIEDLFDRCLYTVEQKWIFLEGVIEKDERFVIIDDRGDTLEQISKKYRRSLPIQVKRIHIDNDDPHLSGAEIYDGISVSSLKRAIQYL